MELTSIKKKFVILQSIEITAKSWAMQDSRLHLQIF